MSLVDQVREFARLARLAIIQQLQADGKAKPGKARWIGYDSNGNGLVKQDSEIRTVKIIGNISLTTGSNVYVDEENTIEIKQKRRAAERPKFERAALPKPKEQLVYRPLVYVPERQLVGDYLLIYREVYTGPLETNAEEKQLNYLELQSETFVETKTLWQGVYQYNPRNADMLIIKAAMIDLGAINPFAMENPPSVNLTFGSSQISLEGGIEPVIDLPGAHIASVDIGQNLGYSVSMSPGGISGFSYFRLKGSMFSYRNSPIYYVTGEFGTYAIDLSNYVSNRVGDSVLLHSYTSSPGGSSRYLYNIFAVASFNLTVEDDPANIYNSLQDSGANYFYACPLTYQYVFTKTNLRTGVVEGRSVVTTLFQFDDQQTGSITLRHLFRITIDRNIGDFPYPDAAVSIASLFQNQLWLTSLDPRPLFYNADPDDWIYQVKDAIEDFPDNSTAWNTVRAFLQKSYRDGKLNNYFTDNLPEYSSPENIYYPTVSEKTIDLALISSFSDIQTAFSGATVLGSLDSVIETEDWIDHVTAIGSQLWRKNHGPNLETSLPQFTLPEGVHEESIDKTTTFALNLGSAEYVYLDP